MSKLAQLLFLGTGGSVGIPMIGCSCAVCKSELTFNKRLRPSVLLKIDNKSFLIDCGPDFRFQALCYDIREIDGILITHPHHDHTAGIDELRVYTFRRKNPIPCLMSQETYADLKRRFYYIFPDGPQEAKLTSKLEPILLPSHEGDVIFENLEIQFFSFFQGETKVNGFRFGDIAYLSDIKSYPENIFSYLKNLKTLIISALRFTPSYLHLSIDEAVEFAKQTGAEKTLLTHISHDVEHEHANAYLPKNIQLAYDGLIVECELKMKEV
jgi:phosphoribosyl 1,2-cyclic phosphate phosphodiesterase